MKSPCLLTLKSAIATFSVLAAITPATAKAVTNEQINRIIEEWNTNVAQSNQRRSATPAIPKSLDTLDVESLSPEQYLELCREHLPECTTGKLLVRFEAVGKRTEDLPDAFGAEATVHGMQYLHGTLPDDADEGRIQEYKREREQLCLKAVRHPGMVQALKEGHGNRILTEMYFAENKQILIEEGVYQRFSAALAESFPAKDVRDLLSFFRTIRGMDTRIAANEIERIRKLLASKLEERIKDKSCDQFTAPFFSEREYLTKKLLYVNSAFARGMLLDHDAPAMEVLWTYPEIEVGMGHCCPSPPSEPDGRISRIRLASR